MSVAPGSPPVDEHLELAGNICPIGRSTGNDYICIFEFLYRRQKIILQIALRRFVAGSASFAEFNFVIVDADGFYFMI